LLAVPDGQIAAAAETLAAEVGTAGRRDILSKKVCLHCSGSLGLDPLAALSALGIHCGSLHPLQSFAGGSARFKDIGMAVDGDNEAQQAACYLAEALQAYPFRVPEAERSAYHAAACFCSNYLVTITAIAQQLFERWTPDKARALQFLLPLLDGTVSNLHQTSLASWFYSFTVKLSIVLVNFLLSLHRYCRFHSPDAQSEVPVPDKPLVFVLIIL